MPIKTTVITGATSGIGRETTLALAKQDHALYLLVRNQEKGEQLKSEISAATGNQNVFIVYCDLADLASVKAAANLLKEKLFAINVLINNAGGVFNQYEESADGYETTFAMNHLGHFLLTLSLMRLLERGQARVINLSSEAHKIGNPDFETAFRKNGYSAMKAYGTAKLCNIYFTRLLAERYADKGITSFAVHPGVVNTNFGVGLGGFGNLLLSLARPFMITPEKGAKTSIYLATSPKLDKLSGAYLTKCKPAKAAGRAANAQARQKLWEVSEKLIAKFL